MIGPVEPMGLAEDLEKFLQDIVNKLAVGNSYFTNTSASTWLQIRCLNTKEHFCWAVPAKSWRGPGQGVSSSSIGVREREGENEEEEVLGLEGIAFVTRIIRTEGTEGLHLMLIQGEGTGFQDAEGTGEGIHHVLGELLLTVLAKLRVCAL